MLIILRGWAKIALSTAIISPSRAGSFGLGGTVVATLVGSIGICHWIEATWRVSCTGKSCDRRQAVQTSSRVVAVVFTRWAWIRVCGGLSVCQAQSARNQTDNCQRIHSFLMIFFSFKINFLRLSIFRLFIHESCVLWIGFNRVH